MTSINPEFKFKGEALMNRYLITGTLEAVSPLHIGNGMTRPDTEYKPKNTTETKEDETPKVDEICRDINGSPYIPGSALRGVVRNYLLQIFRGCGSGIADDRDYEQAKFKDMDQAKQKEFIRSEASLLEQIFGTPLSESKADFWDAELIGRVSASALTGKGWNDQRQTYVVRSVCIDPVTGAAEPNKLYSFDVVPKGAKFRLTIAGQNLNDLELGFLLFGVYGFNSEIFPLTIGAMSGRGFGRMRFALDGIRLLDKDRKQKWLKHAIRTDHAGAGFDILPKLTEKEADEYIAKFKQACLKIAEGAS